MAQVYDRTWGFSFDNAQTDTSWLGNLNRTLWSFGSLLTGGTLNAFAGSSGKWTLVGSSDGVTAGHDATDRLHFAGAYTAGDWVHAAAGVAHSWFVLQSPATMNGYSFYMLVSCNSSAQLSATVFQMSKAAFSGGTILNNPTSTDSWNFIDTPSFSIIDGTVSATWKHSMCLSTTGDFIFFSVRTGASVAQGCQTYVSVMAPVGCHASDLYPVWQWVGPWPGNGDVWCVAGTSQLTRNAFGAAAVHFMPYMTRWYVSGGATTDSLAGTIIDAPCWIIAAAQAANYGWHARGRLPDMTLQTYGSGTQMHAPGLTIRDGGGTIRYVTIGAITIPANAAPNFA
jgi:hypothetical protein